MPTTKRKVINPRKPARSRAVTTTTARAVSRRKPPRSKTTPTTRAKVLKISVLQPRFKAKPKLTLSRARKTNISTLRLANISQARVSVAALKIKPTEVSGFMEEASKSQSQLKQLTFTRAMIANWKTDEDVMMNSQALSNWARVGDVRRRKMVCKAFRENGESGLMVHNIGGMEKKDARAMMKDYFSSGGSMADVMEWLREAGNFLRLHSGAKTGTDGFSIGRAWRAVKKVGKAAVDWATAAVNTVSDAIKAAGKNLARAIREIADWSIAKITDVVEGLLRAGRRVAEILQEALKKSAAALKKFTRAILATGRKMREALSWAAGKTLSTLKTVLSALDDARKSVRAIVQEALKAASRFTQAIIKAMLQMGKKLVDIVRTMVRASYDTIRKLTDALLKAGKSILLIVKDVLQSAGSALNYLVKSMLSLGKNLGEILYNTFNHITFGYFKKLVKAAMAAGKRIADFVQAGISRGWALLRKAAQALFEIGQKAGDLLYAAARKASSAVREVIKGLAIAGRKAAQILTVVANYTGTYLRRMVKGFYQVFKDPIGVLKRFAQSKLNTIRMVLDGLLQAGLTFGRALKEILVNIKEGFREGFFKGLVALGKSVVDIMEEALKLTGALAGLALATLLDLLGGHRGLTAIEKREARKIFGASIDLNRIKISDASLASDLINLVNGARPFTTMYVINFASWKKVDLPTLIHELTHTWQGTVVGPIYMVEALHAQFKEGSAAYKVTLADLAANNGDFSSFNREQQGRIVEHYYNFKFGSWKTRSDAATWVKALKPYASQVYKSPRIRVRYDRTIPTSLLRIKPALILATS